MADLTAVFGLGLSVSIAILIYLAASLSERADG